MPVHTTTGATGAVVQCVSAALLLLLHLADNLGRLLLRAALLVRELVDGVLWWSWRSPEAAIRRVREGAPPLHHLAVVLNDDLPAEDAARLAVWAAWAGATHVSLFDPRGRHKRRRWRVELDEALYREGLPPSTTPSAGARVDGPRVTLLDHADGTVTIGRVARRVCQDVQDGGLSPDDITMQLLDGRIAAAATLPEPELAVYLGEEVVPCGLLPWHQRYTSMLAMTAVSPRAFINVLLLYGACKQRRGA